MAIAPERSVLASAQPLRTQSRALLALPITALVVDLAVITVTVVLAAYVRGHIPLFGVTYKVTEPAALVSLPLVASWIAAIALRGGYDRGVFGAGADEYKIVVGSSLFTAAFLGIGCYLTQFELSRGFFVFAFLIGPAALAIGRFTLRRWLHHARRLGALGQRTVIVGGADHVDAVADVFTRESWLGYHVVGAITPTDDLAAFTHSGLEVLGDVDAAAGLVRAYDADVVFVVAGAFNDPSAMRSLVWDLESDDVQVILATGMTDVSSGRIRVRPVAGLPLLHLDRPRSQEALRWAKRTFDIVVSATLLLLTSPLVLLTAWRIKRHDGGPVLFRQVRVGRDGAYFTCLKLRSMVVDAEAVLGGLRSQVGHDEGLFKMHADPRITKPGQWIRRYSLDELPQLLN